MREAGGAGRVTALVVEDEENLSQSLSAFLRGRGHHVVSVADSRSALQALRDESFDVVLLDLGIRDADGLELVRHIRAMKAKGWSNAELMNALPSFLLILPAWSLGEAIGYLEATFASRRAVQALNRDGRAVRKSRSGPHTRHRAESGTRWITVASLKSITPPSILHRSVIFSF